MTIGTVTSTGLGSGLDIESLVTGLVNAERAPTEAKINRQESRTTSLISALGELTSSISGIQSSVSTLAETSTFTNLLASTDDAGSVIASANANASAAAYDVEISTLASKQSLASTTFAAADTIVGGGILTIDIGTPTNSGGNPVYSSFSAASTVDVTIAANSTLTQVKDAINAANAGVEASIVKDGSQFRLLIASAETGVENSIQITVDDDDGTDQNSGGLSALAFNSSVSNLSQTNAATDAAFTLNGLGLTSSSNTVTEVVTGVTLTLNSTTTSPARIEISEDRNGISQAISSFVSSYNSYVEQINSQTTFNPTTEFAGPLVGDFTARTVESALRRSVTESIEGVSSFYTSLATVGITTKADGTLEFNSTQLNAALDEDKNAVITLFTGNDDGSVTGVAERLGTTISNLIDGDGLLQSRSASLTDRLDGFDEQRRALDRRLDIIEARFRSQFNALDILVAQLNTTGDFLQSQLASLPFANQQDD